jgi:hypothetical protein
MILATPASASPPVTVTIRWPYGPAPTTGTLTVTIEEGADKATFVDDSGNAISDASRSWTNNYPKDFQIRAKSASSTMNDIKLQIQHDSGPVKAQRFTAVKVEVISSTIQISQAISPPSFYPGNPSDREATDRYGFANHAVFHANIRVIPKETVDYVTPQIVQIGTGMHTFIFRNPPPGKTKSTSTTPSVMFDGKHVGPPAWIKNKDMGVWYTDALYCQDTPTLIRFCKEWTELFKFHTFVVYIQYFLSSTSPITLSKGEWSYGGNAKAGTFSSGAYTISGTGAIILVASQFAASSEAVPVSESPNINETLSNMQIE